MRMRDDSPVVLAKKSEDIATAAFAVYHAVRDGAPEPQPAAYDRA
jgi:hypothetical protein